MRRSRTITVRLPSQSYLILKQYAEREADSISDYIRALLDERFLQQQEADRLAEFEARLLERLDHNHQLVVRIAKFLKNNR